MEDYIFVEGKRYISAKKAAQETGYTSDYVGQMAREGRVDSKKVGRIRYVDEDQVKGYTVTSDRKKTAARKFADSMPSSSSSTPEVVSDQEPEESIPEPAPAPETAPEQEPEPSNDHQEEEKEESIPSPVSGPDLDKVFASAKDSLASIPSTISKIDLGETANKAVALAIAIMIVASPYLWSNTSTFSDLGKSFSLAYEAVMFDMESIAVEVYGQTQEKGFMGLVVDSLAYSEERIVSGLGSAFYAYSNLDEMVAGAPDAIAQKELNLKIDGPTRAMKATAIESGEELARDVYEWFYVRGF